MDLLLYLQRHYAPSRVNLSAPTLKQMEIAVRQLNLDLGEAARVEDLSETLILSHMKSLLAKGISPTTVNVRRGYFRSLWKHAFKKRVNQNNFFESDIPKATELMEIPIAWSMVQLETMLHQAKHFSPRKHPFCGRRFTALLLLLYYTGLRISAALNLKRSALHGRILIVPAGSQKNRQGMAIRLPQSLVGLLLSLPRPHQVHNGRLLSEYLIPWPWSLKNPQKILAKYVLAPAGLPLDRKLKFHAIRKTVATVMEATKGIEAAKDAMGHSSIKVTRRYIAPREMVDSSLTGRLCPMDVLPPLDAS
jgi:integrase